MDQRRGDYILEGRCGVAEVSAVLSVVYLTQLLLGSQVKLEQIYELDFSCSKVDTWFDSDIDRSEIAQNVINVNELHFGLHTLTSSHCMTADGVHWFCGL